MTCPLEASYGYCRRVARESASSFCWTFLLLPQGKRQAMYALYAFSRYTDDLGDGTMDLRQCPMSVSNERLANVDGADSGSGSPSFALRLPSAQTLVQRRVELTRWRQQLELALQGRSDHPILHALADTVSRFSIPHAYLFDIIDGVAMDLDPVDFETFAQLHAYCYRVASAVGLACIHIWGFQSQEAIERAVDCGIAFQLTNIIRDIREDALVGRVYLPREDLDRFGCRVAQLRLGPPSRELAAMIAFQIDRAETHYRNAAPLVHHLSSDGRRVLCLMMATYWQLLGWLRQRGANIGGRPTHVGGLTRIAIAGSALLPWGAAHRGKFQRKRN